MKTVITALAASISCLISASSFAQGAPVGGLPGLAEQVEQNAEDIAANAAAIAGVGGGQRIYADGEPIGILHSIHTVECRYYTPEEPDLAPEVGDAAYCRRIFWGLSSTRYLFGVEQKDADEVPGTGNSAVTAGALTSDIISFGAPGCADPVYLSKSGGDFSSPAGEYAKVVVGADDPADPIRAYYALPADPVYLEIFSRRYGKGSPCVDFGGSGLSPVIPAFPNDPAITGVPSEGFTPPITIGP